MSHRYQVKWTDKDGKTRYGIYLDQNFVSYKREYKGVPKGHVIVSDALLPLNHVLLESNLTDVPLSFDGEVDKYVDAAYKKAQKVSDALKGRFGVGALFEVGVADGCACYVVTRVAGAKCDVEWRGYGGGDRYTDHYWGWGRKNADTAEAKRYFKMSDGMRKLFSKKA